MALLQAFFRLLRVLVITLYHILKFSLAAVAKGWSPNLAAAHARQWAGHLVRGLSIRITLTGAVPEKGVLVVSNHRSYLDIVVILSQMDAAFLAELKAWPIFGYAAQKGNTVFVDRGDTESRARARQALADRISQGVSVVVFPEGTTFKGPGLLPFKNGIFHMAAERGIPVVPVTIIYKNKGKRRESFRGVCIQERIGNGPDKLPFQRYLLKISNAEAMRWIDNLHGYFYLWLG